MTHKPAGLLKRRVVLALAFGLCSLGIVGLGAIGINAAATLTTINLIPGDSAHITCSTRLSGTIGSTTADLVCAALTATPTRTAVATATRTPTVAPAQPTSTPVPGSSDGALGNSAAFGIWTPTARDTCTKAEHDAFYVIAPDGLRYPTWHPPVFTRANGTTCSFGHEHGQDPRAAAEWTIAQRHYARTLSNGSLDLAHAGIPFGYVNQQMDKWIAATGNTAMAMRHEDHVGHKVATANNLGIGLNPIGGGTLFYYPGVTCNYLIEYHQGTHSKDAFENNLHQILYNADCSDGHGIHLDTMGEFGQVGQFTRSCDPAGDRTTIITTGTDYASPAFPGSSDGARGIVDRSCVQTYFLVPLGSFSPNPYEFWPVSPKIRQANGNAVVDGVNLLFDVEDSIRYYWPGHASNGTTVDNLGYFMDTCYENLNGRSFRGNLCDASTNSGAIKGITWDDPRSDFRDLHRGVYFKPGVTHNAGGSTVWYTDPFGGHAQTTPFAGSLKQLVTADSTDYGRKANAFEAGTVVDMRHNDGGRTVHAPN